MNKSSNIIAITKKHLARKALAFNLKIKYYNRTRLPADVEAQYCATYCASLDELLSVSDIVSINCPLNAATTGLIGRKEFGKMKDGVFFINTARGMIVDEGALVDALESGKVKMAGLDVFPNEPEIKYVLPTISWDSFIYVFIICIYICLCNCVERKKRADTTFPKPKKIFFYSPYFRTSDKVIIQPHLGGLTDGAFSLSEMECFENIKACLSTGAPLAPVNFVER